MTSPDDIRQKLDAIGARKARSDKTAAAIKRDSKAAAIEADRADLDIAEIARRLKVTRQTIYTWIENGEQ